MRSHRTRLDRLSDRIGTPAAREEWLPWQPSPTPGVMVRDRVDGTGCEIAYLDTEEGRAALDDHLAHQAGISADRLHAEFPGVYDQALGLDAFRRLDLLLGKGHVLIDDAEDVAACERVLGCSMYDRLGMSADLYVTAHPEAVVIHEEGRKLFLRGIPWGRGRCP